MWYKNPDKLYIVKSRRDVDCCFIAIEGIFIDMDSCVEGVIEALRAGYAMLKGDFPEDKIRKEVTNNFNKYNSYWNDFVDVTFDIETSHVWKYEKENK